MPLQQHIPLACHMHDRLRDRQPSSHSQAGAASTSQHGRRARLARPQSVRVACGMSPKRSHPVSNFRIVPRRIAKASERQTEPSLREFKKPTRSCLIIIFMLQKIALWNQLAAALDQHFRNTTFSP